MAKFFGNLHLVLLVGLVLAIAVAFGVGPNGDQVQAVFRWLHVLSGILWIGLLYYFNFVQIPTMPKIPDDQKPAVSKFIAPEALWYFRWAAMATIATGLILAYLSDYLWSAITLGAAESFANPMTTLIGIGMWLGSIMWFNVWFVIWPNQKKALGIVTVEADVKAKAARTAMLFSRTNTVLSVPMLLCMVGQGHFG